MELVELSIKLQNQEITPEQAYQLIQDSEPEIAALVAIYAIDSGMPLPGRVILEENEKGTKITIGA